MTDTEQTLWYYLRGKRFLGYKFKRQVPIGNYIVDFLCTDNKTIIELDGAGHLEPIQIQHDNEREIYLKEKITFISYVYIVVALFSTVGIYLIK